MNRFRKIAQSKWFLAILVFQLTSLTFAQFSKVYEGPDDPAGDQAAVRSAPLQGNRMFFLLNNNSSICDTGHGKAIWNKWPDIYTGFTMMHGVNAMLASRSYVANDTVIVDQWDDIQSRNDLTVLYRAQHGWRGRNDNDPTGVIEWGFKPVITYMNPLSETMAMSNRPDSWPVEGWPARGRELKWPGEWDGRFGRGVAYADQEAYFVLNDAQDQEYLGEEDTTKYYPRPGVFIGDIDPNVTVQKGLPWGGLGLRLAVRVFQWNNPQARDAVFVEYTAANISNYDIPEMAFGYYLHPYIGEDHGMTGDDYLFFDKQVDMSYNWDRDGIGSGGLPTGAFGMAYLESPANPYDGTDNDDDGLVDEARDNVAVNEVGPYEGIADLQKFLDYYNMTEDMLQTHWDADEDQDWQDGHDLNGNGIYDPGEDPGNDVGLDGVGPGELNYTGPDEGECNHRPDFVEGAGCEPNFAFTDVSESDMLGLTSFHSYDHESEPRIHTDDKRVWEYFSDSSYDPFADSPGSWVNLFATGIFPLYKGRTERISMGLVASYDPLEGLNSPEHTAPSLYRKKEVIQIIYENDYRFAMPPKMPTLKATAGDGKVTLTWDNASELHTREPLLANANDFEGYKLYKSTDKNMLDPEIITDGYGTRLYKRPIFQCDLINNINGFSDFGLVDGTAFNLGTDNGIQHYFVDTEVENGKTYYYALAAYDHGIPELGNGVTPSENNIVIELDDAEEIVAIGRNVQIVTPRQTAAGYVPPEIELIEADYLTSSGRITPKIVNPGEIKENHTYRVSFSIDTTIWAKNYPHKMEYLVNGYSVDDLSENKRVLSKVRTSDSYEGAPVNSSYIDTLGGYSLKTKETFQTDVFDGLALNMLVDTFVANDTIPDPIESGWRNGNHDDAVQFNIIPTADVRRFPWTYDIVFGDEGFYTGQTTSMRRVKDEFNQKIDADQLFGGLDFNMQVQVINFTDSSGVPLTLDLVGMDADSNGVFELPQDRILCGYLDVRGNWHRTIFVLEYAGGSALPQANDVYRLAFKRPFFLSDCVEFKVLPQGDLDKAAIASSMDDIEVVPNPYVATNHMEAAVANRYLNQRRQIMFTHLPASCEIKIFTVSGVLVDELTVENAADNGIAHWDVLTREGLEVAAGVYIYHVKAAETGDEKLGKFSIIK